MSCIRINCCRPSCDFNASFPSLTAPQKTLNPTRFSSTCLGTRLPKISLNVRTGISRPQRCTTVCLFGGKGKASNDNEASPWNALEKAMGNLKKEPSVEELLKQQIKKQEYYEGGGSGGDRPGSGGGGGSDGSGEPEDEGISGMLDELVQVILGTLGIIFLYFYIIEAEEINVFVKDILKFIFLRQTSLRLRRRIGRWERFFSSVNQKPEEDPYWLEKEILNTTTWYDGPEKYRRIFGRSRSSSYYR